jgi:hypothetical protein
MSRDKLFLLPSEFEDSKYPGKRFYCQYGSLIGSLLASFPELAKKIDVERVDFQRPRAPVVALVGEENQSLPLLVLGDETQAGPESRSHGDVRFISDTKQILQALAVRHGFPEPHP